MNDNPFEYFDIEVIAKLHPCLIYPAETLANFTKVCLAGKWEHWQSCLSCNPEVPNRDTCSYVGTPLIKDKQYQYDYYRLTGYGFINCIIYYDDATCEVVGMSFYDDC